MTTENILNQLERDAKAHKVTIDLGNALDKLRNNRDFIKLILDGYLKDEAVRLVHAKSSPALQSEAMQAAITRDIDAIGSLAQYFNTVTQQANIAVKQLQGIEAEREELLRGEG